MFSCGHERLTRAFTIGGRSYVVCLDCGAEIDYDLVQMRAARVVRGRAATRFLMAGAAAMVLVAGWLCR